MSHASQTRWSGILVSLLLVLSACGNKNDAKEKAATKTSGPVAPGVRQASAAFDDRQVHTDLVALGFLADIDQQGLFIDFGTPARWKYTIGNWRTGWVQDATSGTETYSLVGETGRVFFNVDAPGPLTLRLRARAVGGRNLALYLNNKVLPAVKLDEATGFRDYDVQVPAEVVQKGENQLLLRVGGTQKVGEFDVGAAVASLRVVPGASIPTTPFTPPHAATLQRKVTVDGEERDAMVLPQGAKATYYVQVPPKAELGWAVATVKGAADKKTAVTITLTPEGGAAEKLWSGEAAGDEWTSEKVSLEKWADQLVRVEVASAGQGPAQVAWSPLSVLVPEVKPEKMKEPKNVIVLLIDTLRAEKLRPFNPKSRVETPVLDALAKEGTVFELAQSPENWTKPSCASVLTGLFPITHGAKTDEAVLSDGVEMISEHFKAGGFTTASFLGNGYVSDKFGFNQGWDHYTNFIREKKGTNGADIFKEAAAWIEKNKGKRFFTYIQTIDPHVPYDPPGEFLAKYDSSEYTGQVSPRQTPDLLEKAKRSPPAVTFNEADKRRLVALHDGEISYHDHAMGEFIDKLKAMGVWEDTLFVITADHGEEFNEHGSWGHGHSVYQELLHVPLFMYGKGFVPAGRVSDVVSTVDISPTISELAGLAPMAHAEGTSLVGYLNGAPPAGPKLAFSDFLDDRRVVVTGRWKLIMRGINTAFFDLQTDPWEQHELPLSAHPIALRYARIMQGQFLGASNLAQWLNPGNQKPAKKYSAKAAEMDSDTRAQLKALGYAN